MPKYIDTHAHINFNAFKDDGDKVIQNSLNENVWLINIGVDYKTSKRSLAYANKYERGVYAAVGLHPMQLFSFRAQHKEYDFQTRGEEFNYDNYEKLAKFEKTVAIGEIGLDYYHLDIDIDKEKIKKVQQETFYNQLLLARRLNLPAIIHCREAHDDMLSILKAFRSEHKELIPVNRAWAVMHSFSGDEDLAWKYFNLGLLVSFNGMITFSHQWDELIRKMPLDRLMIETDSPYLTPVPFRGKRNEPLLVEYVAERIAQIKNLSHQRIAQATTKTARDFFGI